MEQNKGLQFLWDVSSVAQTVLDDSPGSEALQSRVVDGLDDIPGQLLLVQEVTGRLLEGVGAIEVSPTGNQQVHDVGVAVGRSYVEGAEGNIGTWVKLHKTGPTLQKLDSSQTNRPVVVFVSTVDVCPTLEEDRRDGQGRELTDGVAAHAGGVTVDGQVQGAVTVLATRLKLQEP